MTSIKPDSIDVTAGDWERLDKLIKIIENILEDTDFGDGNKDKRRWILWHFLYIIWHEGDRATKRVQGGGGPARGLMQMEPRTLWDFFKKYALGKTKGVIKNLADAVGVKEEEMKEAIKDFVENNEDEKEVEEEDSEGNTKKVKKKLDKGKNSWPETPAPPTPAPPRTKIEEWMKKFDSFGIKIMRLYFKQYVGHSFPGSDGKFKEDCKEAIKTHTDGWGKWWKREFDGADDEKDKKDQFTGHAEDLNKIAKECAAKEKEKKEKEEKEKEKSGGLKGPKKLRFIIGGIIIGIIVIAILVYSVSMNEGIKMP